MDPSVLVPIFVALLGGGAVAFYTARPRRDSIIAEASKQAVSVVTDALERMEEEMTDRDERIAQLEAELGIAEWHLVLLSAEVTRLGGNPKQVLRKH